MAVKRRDFSQQQFGAFSPEVQAAILANEQGQENEIVGGAITRRDPRFTFSAPVSPPAAPPPPAAPAVPVLRYTQPAAPVADPIDTYFQNLNRTAPTAQDEATIREETRKRMQNQIDAINAQFSSLISQQQERNVGFSGQVRAINARSGLAGSDFGVANQRKQDQANAQAIQALEAERGQALAGVYGNIDARAQEEIRAKREEARGNAERYVQYLAQAQESAKTDFFGMAKLGIDLVKLNPAQKQKLIEQTGYDPLIAEAIYEASKPKQGQITYNYHNLGNGRVLRTGVNADGTAVEEKLFDYPLPPESQLVITPDGTPLIFDKSAGTAQIAPGFGQGEFAKPPATGAGGGGGRRSGGGSGGSGGENLKFSSTQFNKGVAASGLSPDEFAALDSQIQNQFINGAFKDLVGGRLQEKDLTARKKVIDKALEEGVGLGELREEIDNSNIPQEDKEELKGYVEQNAKKSGFLKKVISAINPFD